MIAARFAFNQITTNSKWCTGKCEQRNFQFACQHANGFKYVRRVSIWFKFAQSLQVCMKSKWLLGNWAGAGCNVDAKTNCMCWHNDVAVQHCRINSISSDRLQSDVCGESGLFDSIQDAAFTTNCAIFGQTSACLTHEPHRRVSNSLARSCCKKWTKCRVLRCRAHAKKRYRQRYWCRRLERRLCATSRFSNASSFATLVPAGG